jgi:hypothetical protein
MELMVTAKRKMEKLRLAQRAPEVPTGEVEPERLAVEVPKLSLASTAEAGSGAEPEAAEALQVGAVASCAEQAEAGSEEKACAAEWRVT